MPLKNEFIATDFNLVPIDKNVTRLFITYIVFTHGYNTIIYFSSVGTKSPIYYS